MPVVPAAERLGAMRRLGLSEPLVRLAAGEVLHPLLRTCYVGPPAYVYGDWVDDDDEGLSPDGPVFVPFWSFADSVQGVWESGGELTFLTLYIEDPDHPAVLARTEQGFLAWVFCELHEYKADYPNEFARIPEAAEAAGYRHYAEWTAAFAAADVQSYEALRALRARFIAHVDSLKTSRDRRRCPGGPEGG